MRKYIILHIDSLDVLDELTDEQISQLFKAIRSFNKNEEVKLEGILKAVFVPFKNQFKRDKEKYESICLQNKANIEKRWKHTTVYDSIPSYTTEYDRVPNIHNNKNNKNNKNKKYIYTEKFQKLNYSEKGIMFKRINDYITQFNEQPSNKQIDHWIDTEIKKLS